MRLLTGAPAPPCDDAAAPFCTEDLARGRANFVAMPLDPLPAAFYEPLDEAAYRATSASMSPWSPALQHGGPPCALAIHALERAYPRPDMRIARLVVDFLGGVPLGDMTVRTEILRPGKRIELSRTVLSCTGRDVVATQAWRIALRGDVPVPPTVAQREMATRPPALPPEQTYVSFAGLENWGYGRAIDWRFTRGGLREYGPAEVWTRPRLPLVLGRPTNAVERIAIVADSANGISFELDLARFIFVPPGLTLTLDRYVEGEWTFMAAETLMAPDGIGLTTCRLADERGTFGFGAQPVLLEPRG